MSTSYRWFNNLNNPARTTAFAFTFSVGPHVTFCFENKSLPLDTRPFKRRRPLWDVDGSPSIGKKKRRLRLNLVTSRLSRPFSAPASNIVNRGFSRIAAWAKARKPDKNELRKAAIMNRLRQRLDNLKATQLKRPAIVLRPPPKPTHSQLVSRLALRDVIVVKPRCYDSPLPPSPLGMSNYDALDLEDDAFGDRNTYGEDDEDIDAEMSGCGSLFYSDFRVMDSSRKSVDGDDYDYLDELDGIPHGAAEERPLAPDDQVVEIMKETELQREISLAPDRKMVDIMIEKERQREISLATPTHSMASLIFV